MGRIWEAVKIILIALAAFLLGTIVATFAYAADLPPGLVFLKELPTLTSGVCIQIGTGKNFFCEYKMNLKNGDAFLLIWDNGELYEVRQKDATGNFLTIFKAVAGARL